MRRILDKAADVAIGVFVGVVIVVAMWATYFGVAWLFFAGAWDRGIG